MSNEQYILQSVDNALAIIDLLAKHEELSAAEVARLMEIGKTTAFRLLTTLENRKFLNKTDSNRYRLGVKLSSFRRHRPGADGYYQAGPSLPHQPDPAV